MKKLDRQTKSFFKKRLQGMRRYVKGLQMEAKDDAKNCCYDTAAECYNIAHGYERALENFELLLDEHDDEAIGP